MRENKGERERWREGEGEREGGREREREKGEGEKEGGRERERIGGRGGMQELCSWCITVVKFYTRINTSYTINLAGY